MKRVLIWILNRFGVKATKENLTLAHVKSFLQAKWRKKLQLLPEDVAEYMGLPLYKKEQITYRIHLLGLSEQGRECMKNDRCPCNCTTSEVVLSDAACDQQCFPDMLSAEDWEKFKKEKKLIINIDKLHVDYEK